MARAREEFPSADYIYYADTDHVPYGEKSRDEIMKYSDEAIGYLVNQGVSAAVIACNTATSISASLLREKYSIPIIGMEPAVKPAARNHPGEKILVCATPVTIAGQKLRELIEKSFAEDACKPTLAALPELVNFAERAEFDPGIVCAYLAEVIPDPSAYSAVVLGCTHFPYFRDSFAAYFGSDVELIDGTEGTVNRLVSVLEDIGHTVSDDRGSVRYVRSGREITDEYTLAYMKLLAERSLCRR